MIKELVHQKLGIEVRAPAGFYTPIEENMITYKDKKVIYILGSNCIDGSCCGTANWSYIQVPGFLLRERVRKDTADQAISEIDTITNSNDQQAIRKLLSVKYPDAHIEIWD
jgi:hypothetical protein